MVPKKILGALRAPNLVNLLVVVQIYGLHSLEELPSCTVHKNATTLGIVFGERHLNSWRPKYEALVAEMPNLRVIELNGANELQGNDNSPVGRSEEDVDDTTR